MPFNFISKIFGSKKIVQEESSTLLDNYAESKHFLYFHNRTIYHLNKHINAKTLILDPHYALYLIESVEWQFRDIEHAKVMPTRKKSPVHSDVNVDVLHAFIVQKFNEVLHEDVCPTVNILYLKHITKAMFESLDDSFHALLPTKRLIFEDSSHDEICQHLHQDIPRLESPLDCRKIQSALFVTSVIHTHDGIKITNRAQQNFIDTPLQKLSSFSAIHSSGKTEAMILKVIHEKLTCKVCSITIIASTQYSCDTIRQKLLQICEYFILDIDLNSIRVVTTSSIGAKFKGNGILFCDDAQLYSKAFIEKLLKMRRHFSICFIGVNIPQQEQHFTLNHSYNIPPSINYQHFLTKTRSPTMFFLEGNIYMHTMLVIQKYLHLSQNSQILIVIDEKEIAEKLRDEINDYYDNICAILDTSFSLIQLERKPIEIVDIHYLSMLGAPTIIAILSKEHDASLLNYTLSRTNEQFYSIEPKEDNAKS